MDIIDNTTTEEEKRPKKYFTEINTVVRTLFSPASANGIYMVNPNKMPAQIIEEMPNSE